MILKSMSRKGSARVHFPQLYDYIRRDAQPGHELWHNFMHHAPGRHTIVQGMINNARAIKQDLRHNILYHEVISLSRDPSRAVSRQIDALRQLARTYLEKRAPNQLAYGGIHLDKEHSVHLHLMISANSIGCKNRVRLSKAEFSKVQREIETLLHRDYPDLAKGKIYNREQARDQQKQPTQKKELGEVLASVFKNAQTQDEARQALKAQGIEIVERGSTVTAVRGTLRSRLKTLHLDDAFKNLASPETSKEEIEKSPVREEIEEMFRRRNEQTRKKAQERARGRGRQR